MKHLTSHVKLFLTAMVIFWVILVISCSTQHTPNISSGAKVFETSCATCHNFQQDGIGPHLGGLKGVVEQDYLIKFIQSPKAMVEAKDARATATFNKFGTMMPDFHQLKASDIQDVAAYILAQPAPNDAGNKAPSQNPIPEPVLKSEYILNLQKVLQFPYTNDKQPRTRVNKMGVHPITKETLVADLQGKIYILNSRNQPEVFFDVTRYFKNFVNNPGLATGLGSFAFHPDFAKNKLAYTTHTEPANTAKADFAYAENIPVKLQWVVIEWTVNDPGSRELTGTPHELLRVNVVNVIHGLQEIAFNPYAKPGGEDYGLLYLGMGDGGAVERGYPDMARNKNHIWGKVLRIDPRGNNSQNGKYGIPPSNPYVNKDGLDEVYASGFRNPNRITWTRDGKVIVSNIGQRQVESLYLLKAGKDYGWPDREGTFAIPQVANVNAVAPLPADDAKFGYSYPIAQYDHDEGNAIMGGFEYTGSAVPQLQGKYIFGEIVRGRVFYLDLKEVKEGALAKIHEFPLALAGQPATLKEQCKADKVDLRIGRDAAGELYLMTKSDGVLYKIVK
jgi:glucose/arabinose dehydrogenase/cytochrome c553